MINSESEVARRFSGCCRNRRGFRQTDFSQRVEYRVRIGGVEEPLATRRVPAEPGEGGKEFQIIGGVVLGHDTEEHATNEMTAPSQPRGAPAKGKGDPRGPLHSRMGESPARLHCRAVQRFAVQDPLGKRQGLFQSALALQPERKLSDNRRWITTV